MPRFHITAILFVLSTLVISCSTLQPTTTDAPAEQTESRSFYPTWYSSSEFVATDSTYTAYGTALGVSSDAATQKAVAKAQANFEQHLSSRLESARNSAVESGSDEMESSEFIFVLRSAEATISDALTVSDQEAKSSDKFGYHGFAAVTISREALISDLGSHLEPHRSTWEKLKNDL
ncbi:hypothetical protein NC796_08445 [Aliifodinibius sp. S!AR15-10]|uniref:hypothetical protein n=1 Tax=Aliifodinibius sp. S!AR15-10 TaxID=2950437 RepID=UPI002858670A|nr:hypothetical protein [Aliifodinibius sp. S!AR15-10]MDR8391163.1 hypothetical protein [Aliifodinibius sp. S!AR15-10]